MTDMSGQPMYYPVYQPVVPTGRRPGITTAAAVLGFVQAGLAIFGGLITLIGGLATSAATDHDRQYADPFDVVIADNIGLTAVVGALVVLGSGALIAGSVLLVNGRDRIFYLVGGGLQLLFCVVYFTLCSIASRRVLDAQPYRDDNPAYGFMVVAVLYAVLPVLGLVFASVRGTTQFLQARAEANDR